MTKLERIQQVVDHWFAGDVPAIRAVIWIKRILEERE